MTKSRSTEERRGIGIQPGQLWKHWKTQDSYQILGLAINTDVEGDILSVIYTKGQKLFVKSRATFLEEVKNGEDWVPRFTLLFDPNEQVN